MLLVRSWLMGLALACVVPACGGDDDDTTGGEGEGEAGESTLAFCTDGLDNDGDQAIDCFDHDCLPFQRDCAPAAYVDDLGDAAPAQAANLACLHDNPPPQPTGDAVSVRFYSEDFEDQTRVEGLTVEVYLGNRIEGTPDFTLGPTDADGFTEAVDVPAQALIATRVLAVPNVARTTVEFDVETPTQDGEVRALVVLDSTYRVVPAAVAVTIQAGKGIVAGKFSDCDGEAVAGIIATVEGQSPDIRYFVDEFPAREPDVTTEDGLFVAINIDPGDYQVVLEGRLQAGGPLVEVGRREVQVIADSINVVDLEPLAE
jgi:hypothetical protein